mgnify:CR=1 FL=1
MCVCVCVCDRDRSIDYARHATSETRSAKATLNSLEDTREKIGQLPTTQFANLLSGYGWHGQVERACPHREASCVEPLAKQASVLASESELTGVSLASHAARVASFVHCRTRGCEATFSISNCLFFLACLSSTRLSAPFLLGMSLHDRSD